MRPHTCPFIAPLISLALLLPACSPGRTDTGGSRGRGSGEAVPVLTARVEQKPMPVTLPAVGTVEPVSTVEVRAQVTGQLSGIHFAEGQNVKEGQLLFTLDARPFRAALQQAEAMLARDTATLKNAEAQQARVDNLFQRGLIARDQYEGQRASVAAMAATVEAGKATLENARISLQHAEIAAPISGRTGALGVHAGDLIRANDASPLVVINQLSPVYVSFSVPGRHLADIRRYQARKPLVVRAVAGGGSPAQAVSAPEALPARGKPDATPSAGLPEARGAVSFIDNTVDPATGTIRLKGTFANAAQSLWPGAFVHVTLELTTDSDALVVPAAAVQASQDGQYVFVVKADRTVELRPVTVDRQQGTETVIAGGVTAGEEIVTDGHLRVTPGARVSSPSRASEAGK